VKKSGTRPPRPPAPTIPWLLRAARGFTFKKSPRLEGECGFFKVSVEIEKASANTVGWIPQGRPKFCAKATNAAEASAPTRSHGVDECVDHSEQVIFVDPVLDDLENKRNLIHGRCLPNIALTLPPPIDEDDSTSRTVFLHSLGESGRLPHIPPKSSNGLKSFPSDLFQTVLLSP